MSLSGPTNAIDVQQEGFGFWELDLNYLDGELLYKMDYTAQRMGP